MERRARSWAGVLGAVTAALVLTASVAASGAVPQVTSGEAGAVPQGAQVPQGTSGEAGEPGGSAEMPALVARSLEALGAPEELVAAAQEEDLDRSWPYLRVVDDLDGDGLPDVVSVAYTRSDVPGESELVLVARRGLDGTVLFTHRRPGRGWDGFVPARVGADGGPGLLLVRYQGTGLVYDEPRGEDPWYITGHGVALSLDLVALDASGEVVWERAFPAGFWAYTHEDALLARDVPVVAGVLEGADANRVLVGVYDRTATPAGRQGSLRILVVDGTDGGDASETTLDISDTYTALWPAGDLDGDGRDDYTLTLEAEGAATNTLQARAAADGAVLWASEVPRREALRTFVGDVGDHTGDGASDLVLLSYSWYVTTPSRPIDLVGGADGTLLRSLDAGTAVVPLGDITGDGRAEVGTFTRVSTAQQAGARYAAYPATGPAVYEVEHLVARTGQPGSPSVSVVGDVDGDGVPDFAQVVPVGSGQTDARIVSGRDGSLLRHGPLGGAPTRATIGGDGADFVDTQAWGRGVRDVTAVDGRSGDALWTTRLRARGRDAGLPHVAVADLTGDGRGEVVVTLGSVTVDYDVAIGAAVGVHTFRDAYVLSGDDGTVVWQTDPDAPLVPAEADGEVTLDAAFDWEGSTGVGVVWSPVRAGDCSPGDPTNACERLLLRFDNPPAPGEAVRTATAVVEIGDFTPAPDPVTDLDLYVFESDEYGTRGRELGRSTNWLDPPDERVTFPLTTTLGQPSRYVLVEVFAYDNVTGSGYRGSARIEP